MINFSNIIKRLKCGIHNKNNLEVVDFGNKTIGDLKCKIPVICTKCGYKTTVKLKI